MNNIIESPIIKDNQIDIKGLFDYLLASKWIIICVTLLFSISSVFIALSKPNIYEAVAIVQISKSDKDQSLLNTASSQFGGLANSMGFSLPGGEGNTVNYVIEKLNSKTFLKHLLKFPEIKAKIYAVQSYDIASNTIQYNPKLYDSVKRIWIRKPPKFKPIEPTHIEIDKFFKNQFSVTENRLTGFISIKYQHQSPEFANQFINLVIQELNNVSRKKDIEESLKAISYLSDYLKNTEIRDIQNSVNALIEGQLKTLMLANMREGYIIETIDPSFVPETKISPNRALYCILATFIGFFFSLVIIAFLKVMKLN